MSTEPRIQRLDPAVRKEHLAQATLRCLQQYGFQGTSIRRICAEAGVSIGLISHHYSGKEELVADTWLALTRRLTAQLRAAMDAAGPGARPRLSAFLQVSFSDEQLNPHLLDAWIAFWGALKRADVINRAHDASYAEYRATIAETLTLLARENRWRGFDADLAAIAFGALLDGLWLEHGLNPRNFTPAQGVQIGEAWVDGLLAGGYRRFLRRA